MNLIELKIYSGLLGKAIGVRLGAPIEPYQWDYDKIKQSYGDLRGYVKDSHRFAADDDTNGPLFFVRARYDEPTSQLSAEQVGRTWLNYARDGQGMFWWGGVGVSTEHTAYQRLIDGISPPKSGSSDLNTKALSEQVGGQIFIDSWGLIHPQDIKAAMHDAKLAASVSHDGEALIGAQFIAGMIAGAFSNIALKSLIRQVLNELPSDSEYVTVMEDILNFYQNNPNDFRQAYAYVREHYSYDHYEGACHIIPNACIVLIGLLYGEDDFARSIEITCMCGWDTDSNAGVVGTILGVFGGLENIPWHYREPINDVLIASSMSPTMNITDLPTFAKNLFALSQGNHHELTGIHFDFPYKGTSHGLQIDNDFRLVKDLKTQNSTRGYDILIDNLVEGDKASIYFQTFYQKSDFGDNRYDPVFAPLVYSHQTLTIECESQIDFIDELYGALYMQTADGSEWIEAYQPLKHQVSNKLTMRLPATNGKLIKRIGLKLKTSSQPIDGNGLLGRLLITAFKVDGRGEYTINEQSYELGFLGNIAPFSNHRMTTSQLNHALVFSAQEVGLSLSGNYFMTDYQMTSKFQVLSGRDVRVLFRIRGLENYYGVSLKEDRIEIFHHLNQEETILQSKSIQCNISEALNLMITLKGDTVKIQLGQFTIDSDRVSNAYGHFGYSVNKGTILVERTNIIEL